MKQALHLLYIMVMTILPAAAQVNLVPNPSFEDILNCPTSFGQVICPLNNPSPFPQTAAHWFSPLPNSPDYYNACSQDIYAAVPANYYGYKPANTGHAYAGIVIYSSTSVQEPLGYVEYLEVKLDSPLRAGQRYQVSCYAKPAFYRDSTSTINYMAVHYIPAAFSNTQVLQLSSPLLLLNQVEMFSAGQAHIADTINWTRVSDFYTARGGEEYLIMGCFYNKYPSVMPVFPPGGTPTQSHSAYYMVDDVSVTAAAPCDTGVYRHDTTLCAYPAMPYSILSSDTGATAYHWSNGHTSPVMLVNKGGTYWCSAIRDCGLVVDTFHISFYEDSSIKAIEIVTCDSIRTLRGRPGASLYRWNTGDTVQSITAGYGIFVCTSLVNCTLYIDEYDISPHEGAVRHGISLGGDTTVCDDAPLTIGHDYEFAQSYKWNTGDTVCCITPTRPGSYVLTVTDKCYSYTDSISLAIQRCSDCIFVPNAFTPNKDGINDMLGVRTSCDVSSFSWHIYNRWGQLVFTTQSVNARWNGFFKADFAPLGTYYYYIRYTTPTKPGTQIIKGDITLIR